MTVTSGQSVGTVEVTPSGIPVYFASKPKRVYKIGRLVEHRDDLVESAQSEDDSFMWREVPSVTTVLGVLDKSGPLVWWSQGNACEGIIELVRRDKIHTHGKKLRLNSAAYAEMTEEATKDSLVGLLVEHRLSCNHSRDRAGDRGQAVHDALENWARYGHRPDPSIYPEEHEGYVRGLLAFLDDVPSAEPEGAEVLVASSEYGYAGRYDLRLRTSKEHEVVVRRTATKVRRRTLAPGLLLADLKTSKSAYPTHALQLIAYEQASIESGYEPTDGRGILLVLPDGHYEFKRASASFEDFLAVLEVWGRMENKKDWL